MKEVAWFGSVRTAIEIGAHGGQAVLQVKVNAGLYPKDLGCSRMLLVDHQLH